MDTDVSRCSLPLVEEAGSTPETAPHATGELNRGQEENVTW